MITTAKDMREEELKPCPFCGGAMENRGYGAMHLGTATCPISGYAFDPEAWNHRAIPAGDLPDNPRVAALVEAAAEVMDKIENGGGMPISTLKLGDAIAAFTGGKTDG